MIKIIFKTSSTKIFKKDKKETKGKRDTLNGLTKVKENNVLTGVSSTKRETNKYERENPIEPYRRI